MTTIPIRQVRPTHPARRLPAEWEAQSAVMLTWPHRFGDWVEDLAAADTTFTAIAAAISAREDLLITAADDDHRRHIETRLAAGGADCARTRIAIAPSNDVFVRDHGPITVTDAAGPLLLNFRFNGWGGKYRHADDDALTRALATQGVFGKTPVEDVDFVLEGGSIESDGEGTLLVTASCLLSPSRNPALSAGEIEQRLKAELGADRVEWLHHGYLAGDDTDGHVDTLARFCDPRTIAYCQCPDEGDEHYRALRALEEELKALRTAEGLPYRLMPLPWPAAKLNAEGERLPATYANFLILNGAVLVPTYADRADGEALRVLATCFPNRTIIGIDCLSLIAQHGSLHCATMQLPQGVGVPA
ncbi:MAG: agmatine deiminase family protein [Gammaproteobacteria bacterium]|nr:agmatine deiminase family protein [Gammaproteobacteria bacterium]